jgi:hypothetical protein
MQIIPQPDNNIKLSNIVLENLKYVMMTTIEIAIEKIPRYGYICGLNINNYKCEHYTQKCPYFIDDCRSENCPMYKLENKAVKETPNSPLSFINITHKSRTEPLKRDKKIDITCMIFL